jgi:diguanylate cyclase (GGDEF)-like protein
MKKRRIEDHDLNLLLARSAALSAEPYRYPDVHPCTIEITGMRLDAGSGAELQTVVEPRAEPEDTVFLLDLGADEAVLVAGAAVRRIPRGEGGRELVGRAAAGAAAWRRERLRIWKRALLPEQLIGFSEQLTRAESPAEVCRALMDHTAQIVGGFTALVFVRGAKEEMFRPFDVSHPGLDVRDLEIPALPRMTRPGIITSSDARADTGSPFAGVEPLFRELEASLVAHVPFGDHGVLALIERRAERWFEPEDWNLMGTLSRQAGAALQRVNLFQEVKNLSLADPLTGLANRRQMKIVLERGLAAARRGEGLALVMFDLDGFKAINDTHGHLAGDRLLVTVADVLRREARGADLVVRYGGDEFLVVLPGGSAHGAASLVRRVRERLKGEVELSAGIAEYAPSIVTVEQMIEVADQSLYAAKQHRRQRRG